MGKTSVMHHVYCMMHNENRTEIHTTKGLSHDMDQRKEYVSFRFFQP